MVSPSREGMVKDPLETSLPEDNIEWPGNSHVNGESFQGGNGAGVRWRGVGTAEILCPAAVSIGKRKNIYSSVNMVYLLPL